MRIARRDIVVIGASAGGVDILSQVLADAADAHAAFVVVVHMAANARTALPEILHRSTGLECRLAEDGDPLVPSEVLIAPPNRHLVVVRNAVSLVNAPPEHHAPPAIDPLFRTAAIAYGPRVIAVALSGVLDDGTAGAAEVRRRGGLVVVQDPADALFADIPRSIIEHVGADHVLPSSEIGAIVALRSAEEVEDHIGYDEDENPAASAPDDLLHEVGAGCIAHLTCPECSGTLREADEDGVLRYRCALGHVYSGEALHTALRHKLGAEDVEGRAQVIRDLLDQPTGRREGAGSAGG